jgi:DNA topoisomerase-1
VLTVKVTKRSGAQKVCPQKDCSFSEPYDEDAQPRQAAS